MMDQNQLLMLSLVSNICLPSHNFGNLIKSQMATF